MKNTNRNLLTAAFILLSGMLSSSSLFAQIGNVGIGTTDPNANAILDLTSTNQGLLMPRLNQSQEDALTAPVGLVFYNTATRTFRYQDGFGLRNIGYWSQSIYAGGEEKITYRNGEVIIANPFLGNGLTLESGRLNLLTNYDANGSDGTIKIGSDFFMDNNEIVAKGTYFINANSSETTAGVEICGNGANTILNKNGGNVGIGTASTTIDLAIGDSDTGLQQLGDGQLAVYANNNEVARFKSSRDVQIGGSSNAALIHYGNGPDFGSIANPNFNSATGLDGDGIMFEYVATGTSETSGFYGDGDYAVIFSAGDQDRLLRVVDEDDNTEKFWIDGAGEAHEASDRNYKEKIIPLSNSLEKIKSLTGFSYNWKSSEEERAKKEHVSNRSIGVIAQEVEEVFPELVSTNSDGKKGVRYGGFAAVFIEAFKEQDQIIQDQQQEIDELKARLDRIEALLKK